MRNLLTVACLLVACAAGGAEPANPLKDLPSKPGPHIAKIEALGPNAWLDLGSPAPDPAWGKSRGRAYSSKMAFASDLNGAFCCGTGAHGFVKPDGHYMDDLFFYDANAHRWICLYPGASKETKLKLDEHGFEVTLEGKANPVSYLSHAYNMVTYVPSRRAYMLMYRACPWWAGALPQRADWLEVPEKDRGSGYKQGKLNASCKHPVFWNVERNEWERPFIEGDANPGGGGDSMGGTDCGVLEYLPERNQAFYFGHGQAFFFDFKTNTWIATGKKAKISYDNVGCYDAKRGRMYILKDKSLFAFDLKNETWKTLKDAPDSFGYSTRGQINFDTASGVVIGFQFPGKDCPGRVCAYDPDKDEWTSVSESWPEQRGTHSTYYDAARNVHYIHIANDSRDDGKMYVYRYK